GMSMQVLALWSSSVVCLLAAAVGLVLHGWSFLISTVAGSSLVFFLTGLAIQVFARSKALASLSRWPRLFQTTFEIFREAAHEIPLLPLWPVLVIMIGRLLHVLQLVVLTRALGAPVGLGWGLLWYGLHTLGSAAGDLIPMGIGSI